MQRDQEEEHEHLKIQYLLTTVGRAMNYEVHVASNDRGRTYDGQNLASLTVPTLPDLGLARDVAQTASLIDVVWLTAGQGEVVCAFEVEKSTSIYSGILRLVDLARSPQVRRGLSSGAEDRQMPRGLRTPGGRRRGGVQD